MMYWQFLCLFVVPWLLLGTYFLRRDSTHLKDLLLKGNFILMILALVYTTPWDNYLVKNQVWTYPPERVLGRIGYVPIEEYVFFILQTYFTGLWCYFVCKKWGVSSEPVANPRLKYAGASALLSLMVFGWMVFGREHFQYLALILVWALPVILLQWMVGADYFARNAKVFFLTVVPPTLYLWVCDALAIHWGIWRISSEQTLGWQFMGFPFEEALFFFVTNVMVGLGLVFFFAMESKYPQIYSRLNLRFSV